MWEAIESNRRRSWVLVAISGAGLLAFGTLIGLIVDPAFFWVGTLSALGLFFTLWTLAWVGGHRVLLSAAGARRLDSALELPLLFNVSEEMCIAAGLGWRPALYLIEDPAPNAFAVGTSKDDASLAVTSGLLQKLSRDELQGVIAHEIGHLVNRDTHFMTLAGVLLGSIVLLAEVFRRTLLLGGGFVARRRASSRSLSIQTHALLLVAGILAAVLAPVLARALYFACSRKRELLADATAARLTRFPDGLANALEKIALHAAHSRSAGSRVLAPLCIVNPRRAFGEAGWFSTHPPLDLRVAVLRGMSGGAHYGAYEESYRQVSGGRSCLPPSTLASRRALVKREAHLDSSESSTERREAVHAALGRLAGCTTATCLCGVAFRVPPSLALDFVTCPRCGRDNELPLAEHDQPSVPAENRPSVPSVPAQRYVVDEPGWQSFRCRCSKTIHVSPALLAREIVCNTCGRRIEIVRRANLARPRTRSEERRAHASD